MQTGLIEKSRRNGIEVFRATLRGLKFLEMHCQLIGFLNEGSYRNSVKQYPFKQSSLPHTKKVV
jgi:hypothetical protein